MSITSPVADTGLADARIEREEPDMKRIITAAILTIGMFGVAAPSAQATVANGRVSCGITSIPRYDVVKYSFTNNYSHSVRVNCVTRLTWGSGYHKTVDCWTWVAPWSTTHATCTWNGAWKWARTVNVYAS